MNAKHRYARTVKPPLALRVRDSGSRAIRVLIADAHPILREGLKGLFNGTSVECAGEASTGAKTIELLRRLHPDVIVLDPIFPDMDGLEVVRAVKRASPKTAVVIFTGQEDPELAFRAALSGADGYCTKSGSTELLMEILKCIAAGQAADASRWPSLTPKGPSNTAQAARRTPPHEKASLSPREVEILRCLALGLKTSEIAESLNLTSETVRTHVKNIFRKIGVTSRTQAVMWALRKGLVKTNGLGH